GSASGRSAPHEGRTQPVQPRQDASAPQAPADRAFAPPGRAAAVPVDCVAGVRGGGAGPAGRGHRAARGGRAVPAGRSGDRRSTSASVTGGAPTGGRPQHRYPIGCVPVSHPRADQTGADDQGQFAPLAAAIRFGAVGLAVVTVVSLVVWGLIAGGPGVWGALVGAAVGGAFILATVVTMYATRNVAPTTTGAILLGSWLLKIIIAIAVMVVVRRMDFYDTAA